MSIGIGLLNVVGYGKSSGMVRALTDCEELLTHSTRCLGHGQRRLQQECLGSLRTSKGKRCLDMENEEKD